MRYPCNPIIPVITMLCAAAAPIATFSLAAATAEAVKPTFTAFTGKVIKNKVRMRFQPTLDANVLRELQRDDLLVVIGDLDGFYVVQPPKGFKAYIFRTFVLDNVVEGSRVNVRLQPDLDAPIVAQLNSGDRVQGILCAENNKWLEIAMPESAHFYVAKEYIEKVGEPEMCARIEKRRAEVDILLDAAYTEVQREEAKPFAEMNINGSVLALEKIIQHYNDFPVQVENAKELLAHLQDSFLQKKIAYMETTSQNAAEQWQERYQQLMKELKEQQQRLAQLEGAQQEKVQYTAKEEEGREQQRQAALQMHQTTLAAAQQAQEEALRIQKTTLEAAQKAQEAAIQAAREAQQTALQAAQQAQQTQQTAVEAAKMAREIALKEVYEAQAAALTNKMAIWQRAENTLYENWKEHVGREMPIEAFYDEQHLEAVTLQGLVEEYAKPVKNRPGDFLLLSQSDHLPIAYLYSTNVNLQDKVGQVITVKVAPRANHHFAFPAYYVLAVD